MTDSDEYISFELLGEHFTIKSDVPKDYFLKLVRSVESRVRDVRTRLPNLSNLKLMVFAALDLADELFKTKEGIPNRDAVKIISDLSESLASAIEEE